MVATFTVDSDTWLDSPSGFFVACNQEYDTWFPAVEIPGQIDTWFGFHWYASYTGDTLGSLDILAALGSYSYTELTSFYTVLADGWADAIGFELVQTNISAGSVATEAATMSAIKAIYR